MEGELGSGARIAIALIVVGVIIGIVFVILSFTRGATNDGISNVEDAMEQMQTTAFDDYDQQVVSGTQVLLAIKLFESKPAGVVVITKLSKQDGFGVNYGALFKATKEDTPSGYDKKQFRIKISSKISENVSDSELTKLSTDSFYTEDLLTATDGTLKRNSDIILAKKAGTTEYIRPTAKFQAELIKDSSGTITGVCFTQQ